METTAHAPHRTHRLQCREIWGGIDAADTLVAVPGLDAYVLCRPFHHDRSGGDIHYIGLCGHGMLSRIVIADVSGHGLSVADLAERLHEMMREHMNTPDQSRIARALNGEFARLAEMEEFATAVLLTYTARHDRLIVLNAGHPRPLWYSRAEGDWRLLSHDMPQADRGPSDLPLGVVPETRYHQFVVTLGRGDLVVLYTDPLIEATDPAGKPLGPQGLLHLAAGLDASRPAKFAHALLEAAIGYQHGRPLEDDVTILALHHTAEDPPDTDAEPAVLRPGGAARAKR